MLHTKLAASQGYLLSSLLFSVLLEVLANAVTQGTELRGVQIKKEGIKLSLFTDDIIVCRENLKESTQKTPKLLSKVAG